MEATALNHGDLSVLTSPAAPSTAGDAPAPPKKSRSKQGCLVCRIRRVKCGNERPECDRCTKYGAECVYPEKKRFDPVAVSSALANRHKRRTPTHNVVASPQLSPDQLMQLASTPSSHHRGNGTSLQIPLSLNHADPSPASDATAVLDINAALFDGLDTEQPLFTIEELMTFFRQTQMGAYYRQRVEPPDFLKPVFPDPDDLRSFHHCVTYSFSICVTREDFNPWVQHIAPLFLFPDGASPMCAEGVKQAMLSTGAAHLSYLDHRDPTSADGGAHWRALSDRYRLNTVRLLRQATKIEREYLSDSFLAACTMLLFADILSARVEWREIHRMMRESIVRRGGLAIMLFGKDKAAPDTPSSMRKYLVEQIAFLELIAAHVRRDVPLLMLGDLGWFDKLGELTAEDDMAESCEAAFGIHRTIFHLAISTAIYLGRASRDRTNEYYLLTPPTTSSSDPSFRVPPPLPPQMTESGQKVLSDLHSWRSSILPVLNMDARTYAGSMAYWHACMVLLLRDLEGCKRGDEACQESAREVLRLARDAGDKVEFMMWPLMITASVMLDPQLRSQARDLLKTFQYQCCFEAEGTLRVVEEVWKRVDEGRDDEACGWSEVMLEMGMPLLLG